MRVYNYLTFIKKMQPALYHCGIVAKHLKGSVSAEYKKPDSPVQTSTEVTMVDKLSQEILMLSVHEFDPELSVYSEDLAACRPEVRALFSENDSRYWVVIDSLDGTASYLDGGLGYAHMLGILDTETGRMMCDLIYFPELKELYYAIRGQGSYLTAGFFGQPEKLVRPGTIPRVIANTKRLNAEDKKIFSSLAYGLVGDDKPKSMAQITRDLLLGKIGAMVSRQFHGHDTAIGSVLIEELGGYVLGFNDKPVAYTKNMPRLPLVVASLLPDMAHELCRQLRY
jgi:fructose-1,6-bisphosphatase/inositol monophosphatase family enzyme